MAVVEQLNQKTTFDGLAVKAIIEETGLPLAIGRTRNWLLDSLEDVAREHYWAEFSLADTQPYTDRMNFELLADASVTPSHLLDRLIKIERSAKRVFAGTSRKPQTEKVAELLDRLGYDRFGHPLKYSGKEKPGHGGCERVAVRRCLVLAINATKSPPQGYRSRLQDRAWATTRLEKAIQALVRFIEAPNDGRKRADDTAQAIYIWGEWCIPLVEEFLAKSRNRHNGDVVLNQTLQELMNVYMKAFGRKPSIFISSRYDIADSTNPWDRFLQAVLTRIYYPATPPMVSALQSRCSRLMYS